MVGGHYARTYAKITIWAENPAGILIICTCMDRKNHLFPFFLSLFLIIFPCRRRENAEEISRVASSIIKGANLESSTSIPAEDGTQKLRSIDPF